MILATHNEADQPTTAEAIARPAGAVDSNSPAQERDSGRETLLPQSRRDTESQEVGNVEGPSIACSLIAPGLESTSKQPALRLCDSVANPLGSDVAAVAVSSTDQSGTRLSSTPGILSPASTAPLISEVRSERDEVRAETLAPHPSPLAPRLTPEALRLGARRADTLRTARALFASGKTLTEAAQLVGTSIATLCRLRADYAHLTDEQLTPENCAGGSGNCGRPSPWKLFAQREDVRQRLQELYLLSCGASSDYMTKGRRTGSAAAVLTVFARDPLCPPELARELKAGKQPAPLLSVIREINDLIEQRHRGAKHTSLNGTLTMRRSLVEILQSGETVPIALGDWWVFDDMSDNLPHWWTGPEELPFIGRQGLYGYDITGRWLGVEKIGTVRDSYTAAIILRFLRRLMQALGKPRRGVIFERSVWESNVIAGCRISSAGNLFDEDIERPAMDTGERHLLQQGLEALGIKVHYTYTPRGKEIEGAFNYLQRLKPMMATQRQSPKSNAQSPMSESETLDVGHRTLDHPPVNIGRHAGEYEHGAKQLRRVRARSHHPEDLGFLHIDASADLDDAVMQLINEERGLVDYPELGQLSERDLAVFLPRRHDLFLRDGKITATVNGQPFDFCAPELFASLGNGYRLSMKFDDSEPTLGAAIYNNETSSANFQRWQRGEFIGFAEFLAPVGRFDWRTEKDDQQADLKKRFQGHVRTAFRAVGMKNKKAATARDGRGNVAVVGSAKAEVRSERAEPALPSPLKPRTSVFSPPTREEITKRRDRLAEEAEQARRLREMAAE